VSTGSLSTEIFLAERIRSNELEEVESLCNKGLLFRVLMGSLSMGLPTRNKGRLLRVGFVGGLNPDAREVDKSVGVIAGLDEVEFEAKSKVCDL
jgi:hypothetical protein